MTLLAASHAGRPTAPPNVWDWRAFLTWRDVVWELLNDTINDEVISTFLATPPEYVVGDDLSWLDAIIWSVRQEDVDSKALLADRLTQRFRALRATHGTRTSDLNSFYVNGLLPLDPSTAHDQARAIFLSGEFPELRLENIEQAITAVGCDIRERRVFFETNEEMLIALGGHYMLYGSEYLTAIAAHLNGYRDYRQVLKARGEPTLFVCDVPLSLIGSHTVKDFAGMALEMVFQALLDGNGYMPNPWRGAGFCIHQTLPSTCIVGHYHPTVTRDPFYSKAWRG